MESEIYELKNLLADAAEIGATKALVKVGALSETVSRREAYRQYGEGVVKRWIEEGLLEARKDGGHTSKCRIDRIRLETLAKANNRLSYLSTAERH